MAGCSVDGFELLIYMKDGETDRLSAFIGGLCSVDLVTLCPPPLPPFFAFTFISAVCKLREVLRCDQRHA